MDCKQAGELLTEYIDGCLDAERTQQLEAHLAQCASCKAKVEADKALREELHALRIENTQDFVFDRSKLKAPVVLPLWRRRWVQAVGSAAACLALVIGVVAAMQNGYQTVPDTAPPVHNAQPTDDAQQSKARVAEVPYAESELIAPEGADRYTYYSAHAPKTNEKAHTQDTSTQDTQEVKTYNTPKEQLRTATATTAKQQESDVSVVCDEAQEEVSVDDADASNGAASSGGGGASSGGSASGGAILSQAPTQYSKRTVTIFVTPQARTAFEEALQAICTDGFGAQRVIDEDSLSTLLAIEGVSVTSDVTAHCDTEQYADKIVIVY